MKGKRAKQLHRDILFECWMTDDRQKARGNYRRNKKKYICRYK